MSRLLTTDVTATFIAVVSYALMNCAMQSAMRISLSGSAVAPAVGVPAAAAVPVVDAMYDPSVPVRAGLRPPACLAPRLPAGPSCTLYRNRPL